MIARSRPCGKCPFKITSPLCYDTDALMALEDGREPSCHVIAGFEHIFEDCNPSESKRCIGYEMWLTKSNGFKKPGLSSSSREEVKMKAHFVGGYHLAWDKSE